MTRWLYVLLFVFLLAGGLAAPLMRTVPAVRAEEMAVDQATPVVSGGLIYSYTLAEPKVFWHTSILPCDDIPFPPPVMTESVQRIASYGSPSRFLYAHERRCDYEIRSNLAADDHYVYWLAREGLMRLSTDANPGDEPELINAEAQSPGEVVVTDDRIYLIHNNSGGDNGKIAYVRKSDNQRVQLSTPGAIAEGLQVASSPLVEGESLYYRVSDFLIRLRVGVDSGAVVTDGVTGHHVPRQPACEISHDHGCTGHYYFYVYVAKGHQIFLYNSDTNSLSNAALYTSPDPAAHLYELATDSSRLFFLEHLPPSTYVVQRTTRVGGATDALHTFNPTGLGSLRTLHTDGTFLYFIEGLSSIQRLPNDSAALPQINMRVTGIEVTQAIQNLANEVSLIKNRRTFVRVYVRSDGAAVSGVTAQLTSPQFGGLPLRPVNSVGPALTIRSNPNRDDINQSFLFELPWSWTQRDNLTIRADLNPYRVPLEPNYGDNDMSVNVSFRDSPPLSAEFFRLNYTIGNTTYRPRITEDVLVTYSFIQRLFPLGGVIGDHFQPRLWDVDGGEQLGSWVDQSSADCIEAYPNAANRNLCASFYTNGWLEYYRTTTAAGESDVGLNPDAFYYGMISDESGNFPRGQASGLSSIGPSGTPCDPFSLGCGWDTDGTYADWYAAHEIGHSLGRAHPGAGACGHSLSDPNFPYGDTSSAAAPIGPADGSMAGFDVGDPAFGIGQAVLPSNIWNDIMSYCNNQWISDYTYEALYDAMTAAASGVESASRAAARISGDFLFVSGAIHTEANTAGFNFLRRLNDVTGLPALVPGEYAIRLVNDDGAELALYPFTPEEQEHVEDTLGFVQVVDFMEGTRAVQIVRLDNGQALASAPVSANPPTVHDVNLQDAQEPINGVITLVWSADDPDGDPLIFEVSYSRDNGDSFQPVAINITENSAQIDTDHLGGSNAAVFRVTASDGVNQGFGDSPVFTMSDKPPQPFILSPADGAVVHWGQLVNFSAMALDAQDGTVAESGLVWKDRDGETLGTGALLSLDELPVGENMITFEATNSVGASASATVTVIVIDDLSLPGPTLTVGPAQVGWHLDVGETALQSAQLTLNNAGSDSLGWTAASDQPWLQLSAEGGAISAEDDTAVLELTADPTGLEPATTHTAQVTITKPAAGDNPAQEVIVPVSLSIGDVWSGPVDEEAEPDPDGPDIFIPEVQR